MRGTQIKTLVPKATFTMTTLRRLCFASSLFFAFWLTAVFATCAAAQITVLSGTVTDRASGTPLSGATVTLSNGHSLVLHADSQGRFFATQQQWPFTGPATVHVQARGFFASTTFANLGAAPLTLDQDLRAAGIVLQGTVLDATTNQPVTAAAVIYTGSGASGSQPVVAFTDAAGRYAFDSSQFEESNAAAISGQIAIAAAGYVERGFFIKNITHYPATRHVTLTPAASILLQGVVTDRNTGLPLPAASVTLAGGKAFTVHTDANGAFSLSSQQWPYTGPTTAWIQAPRHFAFRTTVNLASPFPLSLNQSLLRGDTLSGVLTDADTGLPIAGAAVTYSGSGAVSPGATVSALSDVSGRYVFDSSQFEESVAAAGLSGTLTVSAPPGYSPWQGSVNATALPFRQDVALAPTGVTSAVTISTNPSGLNFLVDGLAYSSPQTFTWVPGNPHNISVAPVQPASAGTRYAFEKWNIGGPSTHTLVVPAQAFSCRANFLTQYLLTTAVLPSGHGLITSGGWFNSGTTVSIAAVPRQGHRFVRFSGDLSGSANPQSLLMTAPSNVTAVLAAGAVATTTTLTSFPNPSQYGQSVTFTATVTGSGGTPTGTVTFKQGFTVLGTANLSGGVATFATSAFNVGQLNYTAAYSGDASFAASTSSPITQTVTKASTTTAVSSSLNPSPIGTLVTFTAQVTASTGASTSGSVTFKDGATTLATATLNSSGIATFATAVLAGGLHSITAVYGGNANLLASTSAPLAQSITIPGGIAFEAVAHTALAQNGSNLPQTATAAISIKPGDTVIVVVAASGYSFPTVTSVTDNGGNHGYFQLATQVYSDMAQVFLWGATNVGNAASSVTVTMSNPMASLVLDVATYSGVTAFGNVATAKNLTFQPNITVNTQDANNVVVMGVAQLATGVTTYAPNIGGLRDSGSVLSPLDIGFAINDNSSQTAGPVANRITSSGGGNWSAAAVELRSAPGATTLLPTTTALASSPNPSSFGQNVLLTAAVTGSGGTPTGTVAFKDGTTLLGNATVSGGTANFNVASLAVGSHSLTAVYSGDSSFRGSTSSTLTQTVTKPATTTTLSSSVNPSSLGQMVTFTAMVSSNSGPPPDGEIITFKKNTTVLATVPLSGGSATFSTSSLPAGTFPITASYPGDAQFAASSASLYQTVNKVATATTLSSSLNPSSYGQAVTFTATVSSGAGAPPDGEVVKFADNGKFVGQGTLSGGVATFTTNTLAAGSQPMSASYGGDATFAASTSSYLKQSVTKAPTTSAVSTSLNPSPIGTLVTFTAQVTASTGASTSGSVTFKDGATTLATATLNSSGIATFATAVLAGGLHSITAVYGGNANLLASTSAPLAQSITIPGGIAFEAVAHTALAQNGSNLPQTATAAISIKPGDTVIVVVAASGYSFPTVTSVTDNGGNHGYFQLATQVYSDMAQVFLWGATNVGNAASSVTVTMSNPMASLVLDVATYSGVTAFGNVATAKNLTFQPNITVNTQDANNVVVMGVAQLATGVTTYAPNIGGLRDSGSVLSPLDIGFAINDNSSQTAGPVANRITSSGGGNWSAAAVELRSGP
jgi:hypothetical protein